MSDILCPDCGRARPPGPECPHDDCPPEVDLDDPTDSPDESTVQAVHDLSTSLRASGYAVGLNSSDVVEDFDDHVDKGHAQLDADDLAAFFVVAHRDGQTDFSSSVIVDDNVAWGVTQIQMLGAHFRTVLDELPLDTSELIDAMVDEAITLNENTDDGLSGVDDA